MKYTVMLWRGFSKVLISITQTTPVSMNLLLATNNIKPRHIIGHRCFEKEMAKTGEGRL